MTDKMEEFKLRIKNLIFKKEYDTAIQEISNEKDGKPASYIYYELLYNAHWAKRDFPQAIASLEGAIELNPKAFWLLNKLGKLHYRQKNYKAARECYEKTLAVAPEHPVALRDLANLVRIDNDIDLSNQYYAKTMQVQLKKDIINRTTILQRFIKNKSFQTYLEIGVHTGINFFQIDAPYKIAIDPKFLIFGDTKTNKSSEHFYEVTSDAYFESDATKIIEERKVNAALVDGLHTYPQSKKDVLNVLKYLTEDGIIIMHDCYPENEAASNPDMQAAIKSPGFSGAWMGDVWKTIVWLRANRQDLTVFTLDTDCGLGIVMKGKPLDECLALSDKEIEDLSYGDLIKIGPDKLLGLKSTKWFTDQYMSEFS